MNVADDTLKMHQILKACSGAIVYKQLQDEIAYSTAPLPKHIFLKSSCVPQNKNFDPREFAHECILFFKDAIPCIVIPGTAFDIYGTRHGRGGGWYDRFLSCVPKNWIRIGIVDSVNFSFEKLKKEAWDEPVDWIFVFDTATSSWNVFEALDLRK